MSLFQTIVYDTAGNFTFDSTQIQITGGHAQLKFINLPAQIFTQNYVSSAGFSFNASDTEFAAGVMRQISKLATPTFQDLVNVSTATGSITKITGGSSTWNAGSISNQSINGDGLIQVTVTSNTTAQMVGLATSNPGGNFVGINYALYFNGSGISIYELGSAIAVGIASSTVGDVFQVKVSSGVVTYIKNGSVIYTSLVPASFPLYFACAILNVGDVVSSILLQATPTQYLSDTIVLPTFTYSGIGNIQSFDSATITDTNSPGYILNGRYWNGSMWTASNLTYAQSTSAAQVITNIATLPTSNMLVVQVVTTSQSTGQMSCALFTVNYSGQIYPQTNPTIVNNSGIETDGLTSFVETASTSGSDAFKYTILVNNQDKWWNGAAWANSNGTYAQANLSTDIIANITTLSLVGGFTVQLKAFIHSSNGSTSPQLTSIEIGYDFFEPAPVEPNTCIVYNYINDMIGTLGPVEKAVLIVSLANPFRYVNRVILPFTRTFVYTSNGYVETDVAYLQIPDSTAGNGIVESQSVTLSPYTFTIRWQNSDGKLLTFSTANVQVPNQLSVNLATLMVFPT